MSLKRSQPIYLLLILLLHSNFSKAQSFVFAQLSGSPVNTTGWNLTGDATVTNVLSNDNSEIRLCRSSGGLSGAIFYNQPINLGLCNSWTAEFDFRMYDGNSADGIAFCFLDVPPVGFVTGGGMGIPGSANGLKICFDTYNNCPPDQVPKIEMRWGVGYDECWSQPTANNNTGNLSFIRSASYNHATIKYLNGNISVYVNNILYLTGFQLFNFSGYLGFTAATGGLYDNHSIKNVIIYTDMPSSIAGAARVMCSGGSIQLGSPAIAGINYTWSPTSGLNASNIANPVLNLDNLSNNPITRKYYVNSSFATAVGCASTDSVEITINPKPGISINYLPAAICQNTTVTYTATITNGGSMPVYQWKKNNLIVGNNTAVYTDNAASNNDQVNCTLSTSDCVSDIPVSTISNTSTIAVSPLVVPSIIISSSSNSICAGTLVTFNAIPVNGGSLPQYQWKLNGNNVGTNSNNYSNAVLLNGDQVTCELTSNASCIITSQAISNSIAIAIITGLTASININASANSICSGSLVNFTATAINPGNNSTYQWKLNGNNVGSNSSNYSNSLLQNGDIVSCVLSSNAACILNANATSNNIIMAVTPSVTAAISITASANNVCTSSNISFTAIANNAGSTPNFQWKINGMNTGNNSSNFSSTGLQNADRISCQLSSNAACVLNAQVISNNIDLVILPAVITAVNIVTSLNNICKGTAVSFTATAINGGPGVSYQWKLNGINTGTNSNSYPNSNFQNGDQVLCEITSNAACVTNNTAISNTVNMQVKPIKTAAINATICFGKNYAGHTSTGIYTDTYTGINGCDSIRTLTLQVILKKDSVVKASICKGQQFEGYRISGLYNDNFITATGCDSTRTLELTVTEPPLPFLGNDTAICVGQDFKLNPGIFDQYVWQDGTNKNQFTVNTEGYYAVTVSNKCGTASAAILISALNCGFNFPSGFSPNKDNKNDVFKLLTDFVITKYHLVIYDRWGRIVFETSDYLKGWDGTINNKPAAMGSYVWTCALTHPINGFRIAKKGILVLIR